METVTVLLTKEDADSFFTLRDSGVFDMEHGKVILHFNNSELQQVELHTTKWKKLA